MIEIAHRYFPLLVLMGLILAMAGMLTHQEPVVRVQWTKWTPKAVSSVSDRGLDPMEGWITTGSAP